MPNSGFRHCQADGDRSRGIQHELQLYAAAWQGDWYGQAQLASGGFDRQLQRNLLLGALRDAVATEVSGCYHSAFVEAGRRYDLADASLVSYAGAQFVQVRNDGFAEQGQTGFGLRANAWNSRRWQGFAGLRDSRLLGLGLSVVPSSNTVFRFDLSRRQSETDSSTLAALQAQFRF